MDADRAVVLVPGLMPQLGTWRMFERQLHRRGCDHVAVVGDLSWTHPVHDLAEHLSRHVDVVRAVSGVNRVDFVGHNFGGILARYYAQFLDVDDVTGRVITVGCPHRGTQTPINAGSLTAQLRPGAPLVESLRRVVPPAGISWVNYVSGEALLVNPSPLGVLQGEGFSATNIVVTRHGDLSLHIPRTVRESILHRLDGGDEHGDPLMRESQIARIMASKAHHPSSGSARGHTQVNDTEHGSA